MPRSGTSMMMKMLEAGGIKPFQDGVRQADEDNPKGYYEYEKVKDLATDASWLHKASGAAIKIISALLFHLPEDLSYHVIFMQRDITEVLASQKAMLARSGLSESEITDEVMAAKFSIHLRKVKKFLSESPNISTLYLPYAETIQTPLEQATIIASFLKMDLNTEAMAKITDKSLYRQRQ